MGSAVAAVAVVVVAAAGADNLITQDLVTDGNATATRLGSGNAEVYVQQTGGTCDANGDRINVTSNQAWLIIASPGYVNVTGCGTGNAQSLGYSVTAAAPLAGVALATGSEQVDDPEIGTSGGNNDFTVTVVPRAPASLTATATTTPSISLAWPTSLDETATDFSYLLERKVGAGAYAALTTVNASGGATYNYSDTAVSAGTTYCYKVRARYNAGGGTNVTSGFTSEQCATPTTAPADTTPPVISYVLTPGSPDGNNDWYKSNVTLVWTVTEAESPGSLVKTGCVNQNITADQAATTYSCSATSTGGSAGPVSVTIKRDATAPTISAAATTSPNGAGWYNGNVTVHFTCTDGLSGIPAGACPADQTLSDEGAAVSSTAQTVTDAAGNTSDVSNVVIVKIDKTPPTISGSATAGGDPYTAGTWTNEDVVVSFECTDSLSDVASSNVAGQTVSFEGKTTSVSNSGTCTDNAGNTAATASFGPIWIDKTAPNPPIASVSPAPNAAGWNNSVPATVSFAANGDGGSATDKSGVAGCTADESFTAESATVAGDVASGTCTDNAGNESTATEKTVKIDLTKPTISAAATTSPNGAGWYNGNVTVHFTCTDGLSGIPAGACPADQTLSDEGAAVSSTAQTVTDAAGNTSDVSNVVIVKIDKTPPTISGSATAGGDPYTAGTWTNEDVVVSFECTDSLSDVASSNVAGQTVSFEGKTTSVSNSGTCTDNAGNTAATASFGPIWIDKTAPNPPIASVSPAPNAAGWNNSVPATVSFAANGDGGSATDKSGVAGCTADESFTAESATVAGDVASGTCTDNAGNESTATEKTVKIDLTKPTATWNGGPANG